MPSRTLLRLEEIKVWKKPELTRLEKKNPHKKVREIKKEIKKSAAEFIFLQEQSS